MRAQTSDESIAQAITAIHQLADEGEQAIHSLASEIESLRRGIEADLRQREDAARRATENLSNARQELSNCQQNPEADCSGAAQALSRAEESSRTASRRVDEARSALARFESAARSFEIRISAHRSELQRAREHASNSRKLIEDVSSYGRRISVGSSAVGAAPVRSGGSGGGGFSGGGGRGSVGGGTSAAPAIGNTGTHAVRLDSIDDSDSSVTGAASFNHHMDYQSAEWATETVDSTILPAVQRGHGRDYFVQRDRDEGRGEDRSLARLYDTTFGSNAVTLSRNADGSHSVNGGYHRIWMARQQGVQSIPARIVG